MSCRSKAAVLASRLSDNQKAELRQPANVAEARELYVGRRISKSFPADDQLQPFEGTVSGVDGQVGRGKKVYRGVFFAIRQVANTEPDLQCLIWQLAAPFQHSSTD